MALTLMVPVLGCAVKIRLNPIVRPPNSDCAGDGDTGQYSAWGPTTTIYKAIVAHRHAIIRTWHLVIIALEGTTEHIAGHTRPRRTIQGGIHHHIAGLLLRIIIQDKP